MGDSRSQEFVLFVGADPGSVGIARRFAAALARSFGCSERRVEDVRIAVSEACTNAIQAHCRVGADEPIRIVAEQMDGELQFEVGDAGGGFEAIRPPSRPEAAQLRTGGLGLYLIGSLFPSAEIEPNLRGGTTVRFTLSRDR